MSERSRELVRSWYVCVVTKNQELKMRDQLMNLTEHPIWKDFIFDLYVPVEKIRENGKVKEKVIEAYKTYLYVEMILTDELYAVMKIQGFRTPLPAKDPTPLPKKDVEKLVAFREKMDRVQEK